MVMEKLHDMQIRVNVEHHSPAQKVDLGTVVDGAPIHGEQPGHGDASRTNLPEISVGSRTHTGRFGPHG